jgi:hypothetical protein
MLQICCELKHCREARRHRPPELSGSRVGLRAPGAIAQARFPGLQSTPAGFHRPCFARLYLVGRGRRIPARSGPVGMEVFAARLVDALVGVRAEVVTLGL